MGKFDLRPQVDHEIQDFKREKDSFNLGSQVGHEVQNVKRLSSFDLGSSIDRVSHTQQRLSRVDESLDEFTLAPHGNSTTVNASNRSSAFLYADEDTAPEDNNTRNSTSIGFFSDPDRPHVSIHALDSSAREDTSDLSVSVLPPKRVRLCQGEHADSLSEFTRAVGRDIMLDRQHHTTGAQLFAGTKALRMHACTALLDMGSPGYCIQEKVWSRM